MTYACSCCGYLTMPFPPGSSVDICDVCLWQDNGVGLADPDRARGPNRVSLNQARENYRRYGFSDPRASGRERAPLPEEIPPGRSKEPPQ